MIDRDQALFNFYRLERRAGADPLIACERMGDFAKRIDALTEARAVADDAFSRDLEVIRKCIEGSK